MSIISHLGIDKANELKYNNRKSYQELIFEGLSFKFNKEQYILPNTNNYPILLEGDIALSISDGKWLNKNWLYYNELKNILENDYKLKVNFLPRRDTIEQHIKDIQSHKYLISGDSLPMHIALGSNIKCLTLFTCTSPWEIYDYNLQEKIISSKLKKYFYQKEYDINATNIISIKEVIDKFHSHYYLKSL